MQKTATKDDNNLCYISGPMSGLDGYNFEAFDNMEKQLQEGGLKVINPANIGRQMIAAHGIENLNYDDFLREDIRQLTYCNMIVMLPGWIKSKGAVLEHSIARALNMKIIYEE